MTALVRCICILIIIININNTRADEDVKATTTDTTTIVTTTSEETTTETPYPALGTWDYDVHCKFQANSYDCLASPKRPQIRWYFDTKLGECKKFNYYRCHSANKNIFKSETDCMRSCRELGPHDILDVLPENAACLMQPDEGECQEYIPMYYFDISARRCLGFGFSGCGGNQNRFHVEKTCQTVCAPATSELFIKNKL